MKGQLRKYLLLGLSLMIISVISGCGESEGTSNNPVPAEMLNLSVSSITDTTIDLVLIATLKGGDFIYIDGFKTSYLYYDPLVPNHLFFSNDKIRHCYQVGDGMSLPGRPSSNKLCVP